MKSQLKFLDDLAQMAGGAVGLLDNLRNQIRTDLKERVDAKLNDLDLVAREDYDRLQARFDELYARVQDLEDEINKKQK